MSTCKRAMKALQAERMLKGRKKYGEFNPLTDQRIFALEMLHEIVDALNYYDMALISGQDIPFKRLLRFSLRACAYILIAHLRRREL